MTTVTIDDTEYNTEEMTDPQKELVGILRVNSSAATILSHALYCVNTMGRVKADELKAALAKIEEIDAKGKVNVAKLKASLTDGKKD